MQKKGALGRASAEVGQKWMRGEENAEGGVGMIWSRQEGYGRAEEFGEIRLWGL